MTSPPQPSLTHAATPQNPFPTHYKVHIDRLKTEWTEPSLRGTPATPPHTRMYKSLPITPADGSARPSAARHTNPASTQRHRSSKTTLHTPPCTYRDVWSHNAGNSNAKLHSATRLQSGHIPGTPVHDATRTKVIQPPAPRDRAEAPLPSDWSC